MRLRDVGKVTKEIVNGELEGDAGIRVTARDERLEVLVLLQELILHVVPHHLKGRD